MISLRLYISKLCEEYLTVRDRLINHIESINNLEAMKNNGTELENANLVETISATTELLNKEQKEFENTIHTLRKEVDKVFSRHFSLNPEKVHSGALWLICSDLLSAEEIFELAQNYKGNVTMLVVIGRKLKQGDNEAQKLGDAILKKTKYKIHFKLFDDAVIACQKDTEAILSGKKERVHLATIEEIMSIAEKIKVIENRNVRVEWRAENGRVYKQRNSYGENKV